jgi:hypothetical protein
MDDIFSLENQIKNITAISDGFKEDLKILQEKNSRLKTELL